MDGARIGKRRNSRITAAEVVVVLLCRRRRCRRRQAGAQAGIPKGRPAASGILSASVSHARAHTHTYTHCTLELYVYRNSGSSGSGSSGNGSSCSEHRSFAFIIHGRRGMRSPWLRPMMRRVVLHALRPATTVQSRPRAATPAAAVIRKMPARPPCSYTSERVSYIPAKRARPPS